MGISRKNMQNSKSLCQYKDKKKEQVMEMESAILRSLWWIIPAVLMVIVAVLEERCSK